MRVSCIVATSGEWVRGAAWRRWGLRSREVSLSGALRSPRRRAANAAHARHRRSGEGRRAGTRARWSAGRRLAGRAATRRCQLRV